LGGGSDIALAVLHRLAGAGLERAVLAVRDPAQVRARLAARPLGGVEVSLERWDALDVGAHEGLLQRATGAVGGDIDLVLCAVGSLGHGAGADASPEQAAELIGSNFTGPATALTAAARHLAEQGHGSIVVLSSVAGLRARRSNYLYGSAKAGLDAFAQGLGDAIEERGVRVHVIRPGFVVSRMTRGLPQAPMATTPEVVAEAVLGVLGGRRSRTVHVPARLGPLFAGLRVVPRPLWRRIAGER
jgi:decaprenylphospho-beta-D-erythro-pentofuranosid-2-ulose 2-reductase